MSQRHLIHKSSDYCRLVSSFHSLLEVEARNCDAAAAAVAAAADFPGQALSFRNARMAHQWDSPFKPLINIVDGELEQGNSGADLSLTASRTLANKANCIFLQNTQIKKKKETRENQSVIIQLKGHR